MSSIIISTRDIEALVEAVEDAIGVLEYSSSDEFTEDELENAKLTLTCALDGLTNAVTAWAGELETEYGL